MAARAWEKLPDEELLDLRFCDLRLTLEGSWLQPRIERLYEELAARGLRFRPHFWLSVEWFSPDGVPGVAIPFYLAHPRLRKLEKRQMLEVEGGTTESCMRILRHETGHAIDTAYRLRRRRAWQRVFGRSSVPYPDVYTPKPLSKKYVLHLDYWYAQSHPLEDFAETFAVWLKPGSGWRRQYRGWPALQKLEYVDALMRELDGKRPLVTSRVRVDPLHRLKGTLRKHYERKRARYGGAYPDVYDRDLRRLFSEEGPGEPAARFLRRVRSELRERVARATGQYTYTIDLVLAEMIDRCSSLGLRVVHPKNEAKIEAALVLTVQTMSFVYSGRRGIPL